MEERTVKVIRWSLLRLLTLGAAAETVWTIYIGLDLPRHYVANHWDVAWVGLDVAQVAMLSCAAWAAWRRSTLLVLFSAVSATLLVTDAWFDVTTARRGDLYQGILLAVFVEVPSAVILMWVAHRGLRHTVMMSSTSSTARPKTFDNVDHLD
jgi:hypothetical protein